jgi:hypothetical protein
MLCWPVQVKVSETGWSLVQRSPAVCLNTIMQKARGNHFIKKILTDIPSISSSWELLQTNLNDWKQIFIISLLMFIWPVISHRFSLDITLGHQMLKIQRKHLFTKDWSFLWISHVTSQVWHPYNSTDFTHTLNVAYICPQRKQQREYARLITLMVLLGFTFIKLNIKYWDAYRWYISTKALKPFDLHWFLLGFIAICGAINLHKSNHGETPFPRMYHFSNWPLIRLCRVVLE